MKPILTLMALAMFVPELLTGSTPISGFFSPVTFLILFLGYGVAVLVVREIAVRNRLNFFGLFLLGFAYSLLNEGLLAKTNLLFEGLPVASYDYYGYMLGLSIPWSFAIGLFHSVCSVMFPIIATHLIFKEQSTTPWISKRKTYVLALIIMAFATLLFFAAWRIQGTVPLFFELLIAMGIIGALALRFKKTVGEGSVPTRLSWKLFWLGTSTLVFPFVILNALASEKSPLLVFFSVYLLGIWFYIRTIRKRFGTSERTLLLFILGTYVAVTLPSLVFGAMLGEGERVIAGIGALLVIFWFARRILNDKAAQGIS